MISAHEALSHLTSLPAAVAGLVLPAAIGYWVWWRQRRVERALKLFEEYHSEAMFKTRGDAWKVLKDKPDFVLSAQVESDGANAVSQVLHYFERVAVMGEYGLIDKALVRRLLGVEFEYWNRRHFVGLRKREAPQSPWVPLLDFVQRSERWLRPEQQ